MAAFFSSSTGNRRGGGGLAANSILPSTTASTPKSKPARKGGHHRLRRNSIRDLLFSNLFFSIALSITILVFVAAVLRYGIPTPISSSKSLGGGGSGSSNHHLRLRKPPLYRKPPPLDDSNRSDASAAAVVDITTKDLYDKIEFLDVDGGPWKQGWLVNYGGGEWDSEKLKVFVVPHSHNDPGWKLTVDEYYDRQSRHILDTILHTLSKDIRRKFIWEEMSYLERWWRDASFSKREDFIKLVKNGQLEIVGGGWVMNDEANSHYFAIVEQVIWRMRMQYMDMMARTWLMKMISLWMRMLLQRTE